MKEKTVKNNFLLFFLWVVMLFILFFVSTSNGQTVTTAVCPSFPELISKGAWGVGDDSGKLITGCNPDVPLIPASIVKIATALAAMEIMGADYRFKTSFFLDYENNLYIRGYGDPFLISEEVTLISRRLMEQGVKEVRNILIDDSAFNLEYQPPGRGKSDNPYDAPIGATSVNFNTVSMWIDRDRQVFSGTPQTPDLPIMATLGHGYHPGRYLINICPGGCREEERIVRLGGELFAETMRREGIIVSGTYGRMVVPSFAKPLYVHYNTKNMEDVIRAMLKYSNNFIANLVYLTVGAKHFGYPATWSKADRAVREILSDRIGGKQFFLTGIHEGAGLSRRNRVTVREMLVVLSAFKPYSYLLKKENRVLLKTGTMKGVYSYAGYLDNGNPFVILLVQEKNTRRNILKELNMMIR